MVHKEQVPPATLPPTTIPPKGPVEASSRDLPLEALPGSEAKLHSREWPPSAAGASRSVSGGFLRLWAL